MITLLDLKEEKFPNSLPELKQIHDKYQNKDSYLSFIFFSSLYLYNTTFCIPGCMFLNILSGTFYGLIKGWLLTSLLTAVGGTFSYILSKHTICDFLNKNKFFKKYVKKLRTEYEKTVSKRSDLSISELKSSQNDRMFLISIRMMPIMPGGVVNLIAPILNIKSKDYFLGTVFGTLPYNFILANVGTTLGNLNSLDEILSTKNVLLMLSMSVMMMVNWYCRVRMSKRSVKGVSGSILGQPTSSTFSRTKNYEIPVAMQKKNIARSQSDSIV